MIVLLPLRHKIGLFAAPLCLALTVACGSDSSVNGGAKDGGTGATSGSSGTPESGGSTAQGNGGTSAGGSAGTIASGSGGKGGSSSGGASASGGSTSIPADAGGDAQPGAKGACCSAHAGNGCADPAVEKCVCDMPGSKYCCTNGWNDACVALVGALGCGTCKGSCCAANAGPGCTDKKVETCVCAKNADCCSTSWDDFCVTLVSSTAGGAACGTCM